MIAVMVHLKLTGGLYHFKLVKGWFKMGLINIISDG